MCWKADERESLRASRSAVLDIARAVGVTYREALAAEHRGQHETANALRDKAIGLEHRLVDAAYKGRGCV